MKMTAAARRPVPRRATALATIAATAALLLARPSPSRAVAPTPQAAGQEAYVDSTDPNVSGETYLGPTYTVPAGGDTFDQLYDGYNQAGTVTHSSGTLTLTTYLSVGDGPGSNGTYNLSGTGTLNSLETDVGVRGTGVFNQSGGTHNVGSNGLFIGAYPGANGTYTLSGGTLTTPITLVSDDANTSTFTQNGGTHTTGQLLLTGYATSSVGTYNLNAGTLNVGTVTSGDAGVSGTSTFNFNGGTLAPTSSNGTTFFPNVLTTANVRNGGAIFNTAGFNVTVGQRLVHSTLGGDNATDGGLTKQTGAGTLTLSGANTYTGPTVVNAGTLQAGIASVAGTSGAFGNNSAVTLANTAGATLDLNGFNTQIGSLTGGGTTGGNVTLGSATLSVGADNTTPAAYAGVISGTGSLTKLGTGTLTLTGANTYTGPTNVNAGTLLVNGKSTGTGLVTVQNSGSVLGGKGTISAPVTVTAGGALNPGPNAGANGTSANVGLLTTGPLTLTSTATSSFDVVNATTYDKLVANGTSTLGGTLTLNINAGATFALGSTLDLIHVNGGFLDGEYGNAGPGTLLTFGGQMFEAFSTATDFELVAQGAVVPEPSTWVLLTLGTAALGLALRRRAAARA